MNGHVPVSVHMQRSRAQPVGVGSLPPCRSWGSNLDLSRLVASTFTRWTILPDPGFTAFTQWENVSPQAVPPPCGFNHQAKAFGECNPLCSVLSSKSLHNRKTGLLSSLFSRVQAINLDFCLITLPFLKFRMSFGRVLKKKWRMRFMKITFRNLVVKITNTKTRG